jgi:hypothetical protein
MMIFMIILKILCRYFTGHTTNADGSPQFVAGKTKFGKAIDGAIKIVTIAVCQCLRVIVPLWLFTDTWVLVRVPD